MLYDPNWKPKRPYTVKRTNVTEHEIDLLLRVRAGLLDGTISAKQFNMDQLSRVQRGCGTVGCIAGWMGFLEMIDAGLPQRTINRFARTEERAYFRRIEDDRFLHLFHPRGVGDWDQLTPAMAVTAIDNWLGGDDHPWEGEL